ncbi:four helix bundle protein [Opitutus terrae]|uniref:S23 ribosomal protein n=1 Tax=Opitutus terrae (strain DSM 11246 / JCM 15787 / PB90-1) TaxID=452637 RepID=B1ZZT3_OPITP|nr:four helix bundle protein [Opitutus terrae]ACB77269.1 hypothetical protein Oter_3995 [Opitutus terrae PB90-1]
MDVADESSEKLEVWRRSHALSIELYRLLADCRDWGFKDQITRAANSISDNIAEGAERLGKAEFKQFLGYAKGSAGRRAPKSCAPCPSATCQPMPDTGCGKNSAKSRE